jgi:Zn-finger nucleic acid-binding protein
VLRDEEGLVVTACPAEHGLFVGHRVPAELSEHSAGPARALDPGATSAPHAMPSSEATTELACPRCKEPMTRRTFARESTIVVDVCSAHGTWFDAGELRAAAALTVSRSHDIPDVADPDQQQQAGATLDVALALEQARDEETARRGIDLATDVLDTFNMFVLGRSGWDARRKRWR